MPSAENLLPIDPHGGHSYFDDGTAHPAENVKAALEKGIFPAITGHNTMGGVDAYLDAMDKAGLSKIALPGVEFSFIFKTGDISAMHGLSPGMKVLAVRGSRKDRFEDSHFTGFERNRVYTPEEIDAERKRINAIAVDFLVKPKDEVILQIRQLLIQQATLLGRSGPLKNEEVEILFQAISSGIQIALLDRGFPVLYLDFQGALVEEQAQNIDPLLKIYKEYPEYMALGFLGYTFEKYNLGRDKEVINKGEIVCLMPQERSFLAKMKPLVDAWRESGAYDQKPLGVLFDRLKSGLTESEFEQLIWYVPHPISIDYSSFGRMIFKLLGAEKYALFPVEVLSSQNAALIDVIEVYNGAQPGGANKQSVNFADTKLFQKKGRVGGSDGHHPAYAGSGGTIVGVDSYTNESIRSALRNGRTLPFSGWGALSTTWLPFFAWLPSPNTPLHRVIPKPYYSVIKRMIDVRTLLRRIEEEGLFSQREKIKGWVYLSKDKKRAQVYP